MYQNHQNISLIDSKTDVLMLIWQIILK